MTLGKVELLLESYIDPQFYTDRAGELEGLDEDDIYDLAYDYTGWLGWHERENGKTAYYIEELGYVVAEYVRDYDEASLIFKIYQQEDLSDTPEIYRKNGWYSSYDGTTFEGSFEKVTAVQQTITVYQPI